MKDYYIKVVVEVDDSFNKVLDLMKHASYTKSFWHSFAPPDKVEYIIGPLTQLGTTNWKTHFENIGCKFTCEIKEKERD